MCPDSVVAKGMVGERVLEEVLKEAHVLHAEKGYLVFRLLPSTQILVTSVRPRIMSLGSADLVYYLRDNWVFALQLPLYTMTTGRMSLLTLVF